MDQAKIQADFEKMDLDKNGTVDPEELANYLDTVGTAKDAQPDIIAEFMKEVDTNGDGEI